MVSEEQKAGFDSAGNNPVAWAFIGENLLFAAQRLEANFVAGIDPDAPTEQSVVSARLRGAVLMLRAAAVECLLKAVLVDGGRVLAVDGHYRSPGGASHDLSYLASLAPLTFSEDEHWMLKYLGFWTNQGRYPVPAHAKDREITQVDGSPLESTWNLDYESKYGAPRRRLSVEVRRRTGYGDVE